MLLYVHGQSGRHSRIRYTHEELCVAKAGVVYHVWPSHAYALQALTSHSWISYISEIVVINF